jgi:hypothetical protein
MKFTRLLTVLAFLAVCTLGVVASNWDKDDIEVCTGRAG